MKPADPPSERHSSAPETKPNLAPEKPSEGKRREESEPQYLDVPWQRRRSSGGRNLVLGLFILIAALALLMWAVTLLGGRAALPLGTALLTCIALFVLTRLRILRQRNGGFVALAVVCFVAALVPLVEYGGNRLASNNSRPTVHPNISGGGANAVTGREELPLLTQAYKIPTPDQNAARFKVLRDLRVVIDEKAHLIKAGEVLPLGEEGNGEVRFAAGDQQIALPMTFVEMLKPGVGAPAQAASDQPQIAATTPSATPDPASDPLGAAPAATPGATPESMLPQNETPAQITQNAQKEAIRRYPALGQKDSRENQLFVETFQELKHSGADDFFADPQWPIQLAELLAKREGWQRQP